MIEKIRYVCEKCGQEYIEQENALKCEARHMGILSIDSMEYDHCRPLGVIDYPKKILVTTDDNKTL